MGQPKDNMARSTFVEFVKFFAFGFKRTRLTDSFDQVGRLGWKPQPNPEELSRFETFNATIDESKEEEHVSEVPVHETPVGAWPKDGPQPSKIPVVLFYLSVVFTMIGSIICIRLLFLVKDTKSELFNVLMIGCGMISVGIYLIVITNSIMNREKNRILKYLEGKVEEFAQDENSRSKKNLRNAQLLQNQA